MVRVLAVRSSSASQHMSYSLNSLKGLYGGLNRELLKGLLRGILVV